MEQGLWSLLLLSAVALGSLHTLAPDHWVPFAAVARARGWSSARALRVTALCGFGHVTSSVLLGLVGLWVGLEMMQSFGKRMEAIAGLLLIGFGVAYAAWGLRRSVGAKLHGHAHAHYDHVHDPKKTTAWTLFLLFSADPCVAVIPLLFAAAPLGGARTFAVVVVYEISTIATMIVLVSLAHRGARRLRFDWIERHGDFAAGGLIVLVGAVVSALGW